MLVIAKTTKKHQTRRVLCRLPSWGHPPQRLPAPRRPEARGEPRVEPEPGPRRGRAALSLPSPGPVPVPPVSLHSLLQPPRPRQPPPLNPSSSGGSRARLPALRRRSAAAPPSPAAPPCWAAASSAAAAACERGRVRLRGGRRAEGDGDEGGRDGRMVPAAPWRSIAGPLGD